VYLALGCTLTIAILIILFFTFYTSIAQDLSFGRRFLEMAVISLSVAAISFGIGVVVKLVWGI
jgi:VIT1/CCC1 family predicted Fe2+/Mn2+ transporter